MNFDHLILLIGTNPLPNYVVARYFIESVPSLKTIIAAHTPSTASIARRLETSLRKRQGASHIAFEYCGLSDPGNANKIRHELEERIFDQHSNEEHYHLNYTGGTKVMGIHAYLTAFMALESDKISFSYLDAREFTLNIEGMAPTKDLRRKIEINFTDLFELHDCKANNKGSEIDWARPNEIFKNWILQGSIIDFLDWRKKVLTPTFFYGEHKMRVIDLLDLNKWHSEDGKHPFHDQALMMLQTLPEPQTWKTDEHGSLILPKSKIKYEDWFEGVRYLDGFWLEYYTMDVLKQRVQGIFEIRPNQHLVKGEANRDFEIDIMLMHGYQFCGISITTAYRSDLCKSKAFEIMHRSVQLGGDEARMVLVSTMTPMQVFELSQDLALDTDVSGQLLILGIDDLQPDKLWKAIHHHITGEWL